MAYRLPDVLDRRYERWDVVRDNHPNDIIRDLVILMTKDVADASDLFPRDGGSEFQQLVRNMAAGFRHDFQCALDGKAQKPIRLEILKGFSGCMCFDALKRFQDVSENWANITFRHQKTRTAEASTSVRSIG